MKIALHDALSEVVRSGFGLLRLNETMDHKTKLSHGLRTYELRFSRITADRPHIVSAVDKAMERRGIVRRNNALYCLCKSSSLLTHSGCFSVFYPSDLSCQSIFVAFSSNWWYVSTGVPLFRMLASRFSN